MHAGSRRVRVIEGMLVAAIRAGIAGTRILGIRAAAGIPGIGLTLTLAVAALAPTSPAPTIPAAVTPAAVAPAPTTPASVPPTVVVRAATAWVAGSWTVGRAAGGGRYVGQSAQQQAEEDLGTEQVDATASARSLHRPSQGTNPGHRRGRTDTGQ